MGVAPSYHPSQRLLSGRCDTYPCLQLPAHLPEGHVLLHAIHSILKLNACNVHVGNHGTDVSDDSGEDENSGQEIGHYEQVLRIILGRGCLTDCGQREGGPIEGVNVLPGQRRVARSIQVVHPIVWAETQRVADGKV